MLAHAPAQVFRADARLAELLPALPRRNSCVRSLPKQSASVDIWMKGPAEEGGGEGGRGGGDLGGLGGGGGGGKGRFVASCIRGVATHGNGGRGGGDWSTAKPWRLGALFGAPTVYEPVLSQQASYKPVTLPSCPPHTAVLEPNTLGW